MIRILLCAVASPVAAKIAGAPIAWPLAFAPTALLLAALTFALWAVAYVDSVDAHRERP